MHNTSSIYLQLQKMKRTISIHYRYNVIFTSGHREIYDICTLLQYYTLPSPCEMYSLLSPSWKKGSRKRARTRTIERGVMLIGISDQDCQRPRFLLFHTVFARQLITSLDADLNARIFQID